MVYNWQRGITFQYIYPETTPYIFISSNGRLYFSEVTSVDEDEYYCQVTLTGLSGSAIGSFQPPSKTSRGIQLTVMDQGNLFFVYDRKTFTFLHLQLGVHKSLTGYMWMCNLTKTCITYNIWIYFVK